MLRPILFPFEKYTCRKINSLGRDTSEFMGGYELGWVYQYDRQYNHFVGYRGWL